MFELIVIAPDGDYIVEGEFETIEQAWERNEDMGSRWVFYPLRAVTKNKKVVESAIPYWDTELLKGMPLKKLCDYINTNKVEIIETPESL